MIMYRGKSGHARIVQTYRLGEAGTCEISYIKCLGSKRVCVRKVVPIEDIYYRKAKDEKTRSLRRCK